MWRLFSVKGIIIVCFRKDTGTTTFIFMQYLLVWVVLFSASRLPPPFLPTPSPPFNEDYPQQLLGFNDLRNIPILETRRRICYNQTIYNDMQIEGDEWFSLTLQIGASTARTVTGIDHTAIRIIDDDG